jgi:hypothetical protein
MGKVLRGVVHSTIVRGVKVYDKEEQFLGKPHGNFLLNNTDPVKNARL